MAASGTGIEMAAESRRAATGDHSQHCQLLEAQPRSRFLSRKRASCARRISATSTAGRLIRVYEASGSVAVLRYWEPEYGRVDSGLPRGAFAKGADRPSCA